MEHRLGPMEHFLQSYQTLFFFTLTSNKHKNIHKQTCTHIKITHIINQR